MTYPQRKRRHVLSDGLAEGGEVASSPPLVSRLLVLDAFRAIAILAVLLHHYLPRWAPPDHVRNIYGYSREFPQWLNIGELGVQFFFIISGFVIFMTLERCRHLFEFWFRRIARLYPAYMVATLVTFVIVNHIGPPEFATSFHDVAVGLTFMTPYISGAKFVEPAYWSLVVELEFYFLVGLVYAAARDRFNIVWAAFVCSGLIAWCVGGNPELHVFRSISRYIFLTPYMPLFTVGIMFYQVWKGDRSSWKLLSTLALVNYVIVSGDRAWDIHAAHAAMVGAFVLFIFGKLNWLSVRPLIFVGQVSYSLYLLHQYIGVSLIAIFKRKLGMPDIAAALLASAACIGLAYLLMRFIEGPAKNYLLGWARNRLPRTFSSFPAFAFSRSAVQS